MKQIAFFDFDGTITTKDTLLEFIKFSKGKKAFYTGFLMNLHFLLAYKTGLISNQVAKEKILTWFFSETTVESFENDCRQFSVRTIPGLIRNGAIQEIKRLQKIGAEVVIVTASAESWVKPWADTIGATLIGTKLELLAGKITGRIVEINCHGEEKVKRIREKYALDEYEKIFAYGDTAGDKPMLALSHESHYKPFRK